MIINFNYKKFFKYLFLFLLAYILLHSFTNAKAYSNLSDEYKVNFTNEDNIDLGAFLIKGNTHNLSYYLDEHFDISTTTFDNYYNDIKSYISTQLGYTDWESFTNANYYISLFRVYSTPFVSDNLNRLALYFYYIPKDHANASRFHLALGASTRSSSTPTINASQTYYTQFGAVYNAGFYGINHSLVLSDHSLSLNSSNFFNDNSIVKTCSTLANNDYGCVVDGYDSTNKILTLEFLDRNRYSKGQYLFYTDSNQNNLSITAGISYGLGSTDYRFRRFMLGNNSTIYVPGDILSYVDSTTIYSANIQDLGNNSYGVNSNTISNIFLDWANLDDPTLPDTTTSLDCPTDREFLNNTCFMYSNDIENFNQDNTNVSNSAIWYVGNNELRFDSSKYYVLSFRVYTQYNLDILSTAYHIIDDITDYPFYIVSKYVSDSVLYKDFVLVIQPTHTGVGNLSFFNIVFKPLSNFTSELNNSFNFGVFQTFKLSEYSSIPTQSDVEKELDNNSLSSISNNSNGSFFSDFRLNDYGLSSIVLYPLNFAHSFMNYSCSSLYLPLPHLSNVGLPCVSSIMSENVPTIWDLYKLIFNGFIIYRILINMFAVVKNAYSPDNDRIEVVDL